MDRLTASTTALCRQIRTDLLANGDSTRAAAQQAYMKSAMPFAGVSAAAARNLARQAFKAHPQENAAQWIESVQTLWHNARYREERYAAITLLETPRYRKWLEPAHVPVLKELITSGAWWDLVDPLASHCVWQLLTNFRGPMTREIEALARSENLWLRRSSIICQLNARTATDTALLVHCISHSMDDGNFFARKAIGWALRQYAKTDPDWVRAFVQKHEQALSPLSRREALKHIS